MWKIYFYSLNNKWRLRILVLKRECYCIKIRNISILQTQPFTKITESLTWTWFEKLRPEHKYLLTEIETSHWHWLPVVLHFSFDLIHLEKKTWFVLNLTKWHYHYLVLVGGEVMQMKIQERIEPSRGRRWTVKTVLHHSRFLFHLFLLYIQGLASSFPYVTQDQF